jgi:hypothetical protein
MNGARCRKGLIALRCCASEVKRIFNRVGKSLRFLKRLDSSFEATSTGFAVARNTTKLHSTDFGMKFYCSCECSC